MKPCLKKVEKTTALTTSIDSTNRLSFFASTINDSISPNFTIKIRTATLSPYADTTAFKESLNEGSYFREYLKVREEKRKKEAW